MLTCAPCRSRAVLAGYAHRPAAYRTCPRPRAACPEGPPVPASSVPYSPWHFGTPGQRRVVISGKIFHHASFADGDYATTSALIQAHLHAPDPHPPRSTPEPRTRPACTGTAPALHPPRLHQLCTHSAPALHLPRARSALALCLPSPLPSPLPSRRRKAVGPRRSTARTTSAKPAPTRPPASALSRRAQSSTPTTHSTATQLGQSARAHGATQPHQRQPSRSRDHPAAPEATRVLGLPSGACQEPPTPLGCR